LDITSANNISENSNDLNSRQNKNQNNSTDESANIFPSSKTIKGNINSLKLLAERNQDLTNIKKPFKIMENHYRFCVPVIISPEISTMKMRELVQLFRAELLIFDLEKRNGIVFNLPDIIQCGMFGICGVANDQDELLKIIELTVNLMKTKILNKENGVNKIISSVSNIARDNFKIDSLPFSELLGKILYHVKNLKK
jgi:hypothetical protein